ncbi:hypothetical protein E4U13_007224 [Claviceps humidiphila]|uniref:Uncharacterized protein n=1 Tax=Claviceps humidiphila TaxID=1294629 RepID=A0A9P7PYF6_9HYPO|nr:hypothetical protein E4U13_007224 [Claviceps humidiphila]
MLISGEKTSNRPSVVNLLPCGIHHDGYTGDTANLWNPTTLLNEDQTAYFRGRKLIGKFARLPERYEGAVVRIENEGERRKKNSSEISSVKNDPDAELPAGESIHITSTFNEICTWTQGSISSDFDQYAKCVDEWFSIAERVHAY